MSHIFLIIVIFIAACIETDIYLPAFTDMMHYFSATEEMIQSILTWNFIGICISGPIYGPISDAIGRKKPLMIALGLFLLGSFFTLFADSFQLMLIGRLLQGLGSGGCFTLGTAIIFDAFKAEEATRAINRINSIVPFIMAAAPMLGGYLNIMYGFRANFLTIALFVLASFLICLFFFDETLEEEKRIPLQTKKIASDFLRALKSAPFWQLTIAVSLVFAGYLVFLSETAVLFIEELGVSKEQFPFYQAAILLAWLGANLTFDRTLAYLGIFRVKIGGMLILLTSSLWLALSAFYAPESPILLTFGMLLFAVGANWINGIYFPEAMEILPDIKGITASLLTSARLLLTAIAVGITSMLYDKTIIPIVAAVVLIILCLLPLVLLYERRRVYTLS